MGTLTTLFGGRRELEVLTFGLQGELFALEADMVHEILDLVPVTEVPNSRPFVHGLINVRGKVVPLADLRLRLGIAPLPPTIDTRIIVLETLVDGECITVGILADKVYEVTQIAATAMEDAPSIGLKMRKDFIGGIGKRDQYFIIMLDIERIFSVVDKDSAGDRQL